MSSKRNKRQIVVPSCRVFVNGFKLPPNMRPNDLFTALFTCFSKPGIEYWSINNLKEFYCNLLKLVVEVCDYDWSHSKGIEKARRTNYIKMSQKKRVRITKIVRHLREEEDRCRTYLLTEIYNEVLKGMK